ncbi:2-keto-3-deoxy-L-rhamnonate aldolase [Pseudovibrio axinellae]|uniref:2-keto-3-deoxy-L-rhamnonate aldolase n=1 Tax=Pseudovibrio axinellae TaxID=989403 RepID=A0A166AM79_9HYPH|nr:aldolase/citrate lyase family protein [Pseudovibrio axinellae]KZL21301.1 2-keto-3-deoxy-L-rhamnonate aldolase [Pseudovibrio axinellae]SEQ95356.1 4-hydroxy-2-oxoheptanedioate aldolase [Pseudovibrio axinellae]
MTESMCLADKLRAGQTIVSAWASLPSPIFSSLLLKGGYKAITLDLQHGLQTVSEARDSIKEIISGGGHGVARICVDDFKTASWLLDAGAEAVIAPMINSVEDARKLVEFCKFPPVGARSFGAFGATMATGVSMDDYFSSADEKTLAIAMIETPQAYEALDDILAVGGLDGIFVGPSDLSLTTSGGARVEPVADQSLKMQKEIARKAVNAGKIAGIYCVCKEHLQQSKAAGYRFMTFGTDATLFINAARDAAHSLD